MDLKFATWLRAYAIKNNDGVEHGAYTKLGKEIGVKPTTLRSILGRKGRCRDETKYLIGEKLGVDVDEIIGIKRIDDNGKPPPPPRNPLKTHQKIDAPISSPRRSASLRAPNGAVFIR